MSLEAIAGSFALRTTAGTQDVTGLPFEPKVTIFWGNDRTADGSGDNASILFGVGISSTERRATNNAVSHNVSPSVNSIVQQTTRCLQKNVGGALAVDFVSNNADGFTVDVVTNAGATAYIVNYLCLGGDDLTDAKLVSIQAKTSAGDEDYTGVGFQGDCFLFFCGKFSTPESFDTTGNGAWTWGFATANGEQGAIAWRSRNGVNPSVVRHRQSTQRAGISLTDSGVFTEFSFVSAAADGFRLNFPTAGGSADFIYCLALKGPRFKIAAFDQPTSTGNQVLNGAGFIPKASLMASANDVAANNDSTQNGAGISIGAATGVNEQGCIWAGDTDNVATTVAKSTLSRERVIDLVTVGSTPNIDAQAEHVSFDADGETLQWLGADGTARQILVLWMGDIAGAVEAAKPTMKPLMMGSD